MVPQTAQSILQRPAILESGAPCCDAVQAGTVDTPSKSGGVTPQSSRPQDLPGGKTKGHPIKPGEQSGMKGELTSDLVMTMRLDPSPNPSLDEVLGHPPIQESLEVTRDDLGDRLLSTSAAAMREIKFIPLGPT